MKARTETRLRRLERVSAGRGPSTILVVEKLGDEMLLRVSGAVLVKIVIATGGPRADREVSQ